MKPHRKTVAISAGISLMVAALLLSLRKGPPQGEGYVGVSFENQPHSRQDSGHLRKETKVPTKDNYSSKRPGGLTAVATLANLRKDSRLRPRYRFADERGRITDQATIANNITPNELIDIQHHYDELKKKVTSLMTSNRIEIPDSKNDSTFDVFRIRSFQDDGELAFGVFLDNISQIIGPERAWNLAKSVPVEGLAAEFGRNETVVKISYPPENLRNNIHEPETLREMYGVEYEFRNPESGKVISRGVSSLRNINGYFFDFISVP